MLDAVARKEYGLETRKEGEVPEGRDVVVGEVDCILVLGAIVSLKQSGYTIGWLTFAIPRFSIAGILCPTRRKHKNDINPAHFIV